MSSTGRALTSTVSGASVSAPRRAGRPLAFQNQAHGALIAVDRLHDGPAFTAEGQALLEAFATSAATAVATARTVASELQRQRLAAAGELGRCARELHDKTLQNLAALRQPVTGSPGG